MKKARRTWAVGAALCFSFLSSCQKEKPAGNDAADGPGQASITKKALAFRAGGTGSGETLFVSRGPQETGIAPVVTPDPNHPFAYFYGSGMGAGGSRLAISTTTAGPISSWPGPRVGTGSIAR